MYVVGGHTPPSQYPPSARYSRWLAASDGTRSGRLNSAGSSSAATKRSNRSGATTSARSAQYAPTLRVVDSAPTAAAPLAGPTGGARSRRSANVPVPSSHMCSRMYAARCAASRRAAATSGLLAYGAPSSSAMRASRRAEMHACAVASTHAENEWSVHTLSPGSVRGWLSCEV